MKEPTKGIDQLKEAVERLHNCKATFRSIAKIRETLKGDVVWEGEVSTFNLAGHPKAKLCFAWSSSVDGSTKNEFYAVLKLPPINTPIDAVRASIINDRKSSPY
jgi:hypothetical protein